MAKRRLKKSVKKTLKFMLFLIIVVLIVIIGINIYNKNKDNEIINNSQDVIDLTIKSKDIYLIKGETYDITYSKYYDYKIIDNNVISFTEGKIKALNKGNTKMTVSNKVETAELNIYVTDLLVTSNVNNNKEYLPCHNYSEEDAALLDKVLEFKINEKGYQTRAGAVEAVRFLTLNFPYRLKYFFENGRLDRSNSFFDEVDGEGRYYHKGLYLTDNKFSSLSKTLRGPQPWGCSMYNDTTKVNNPNGLDCSGFMTWALVNAGYDPGDVGAGKNNYNDITDIGIIVNFTDTDAFEKVKVGDLVGRQGHIAMLIGIEDNKYYIGEALDRGEYDMHVYSYTKEELLASELKYFVYLDNYYNDDGNLSNMW